MKEGSNNLRESSSIDLLKKIVDKQKKVYVYEPLIKDDIYCGAKVINNLDKFKEISGLIVANRVTNEIRDCKDILFSRDLNF